MKTDYDLVIIGAGSAGLVAARFARRLGLSVALVERSRVGGDCTWTGCIPSKALVKAASAAHAMRQAGRFRLPDYSPSADLGAVMERIRSVIREIYDTESPDVLALEGIDVISGKASFTTPNTVVAGSRMLSARRFLICTGASPVIPPIPGLDTIEFRTYETIWDLDELPPSLAIVGAGPVGSELAQAFARLGSEVTLIEAADRILPQEDPEVSEVIARQFTDDSMRILVGEGVKAVSPDPADSYRVRLETSAGKTVLTNTLLLATGRRPNTADLGLDSAGVDAGPQGIRVDRHLRTTRKAIFAAGDVTGAPQFTHYAGWQGFMAVRNAFLPLNTPAVLNHVPRATFTDPEAAHAGATEAEARERHGNKVLVTRWPLGEVDRAITDGEYDGFVKIIHLRNDYVLGATIVAPHAGEMIHEWTLGIDQGIKLGDLARSIHVYPTYSMASQQLALRVYSERLLSGRIGRLLRRLAQRG